MVIAAVAAGALAVGVPATLVAAGIAVSVLPPPWALVVVGLLIIVGVVQRRSGPGFDQVTEGELLRRISGRVASGGTLRSTIADASMTGIPDAVVRLARLGQPMGDVGVALARTLPINGQAFRAICSFSEHTGASCAAALGELADRADEFADMARQRKVAIAQTKLSAIVVGVVPMAVSILLLAFRGVPSPGGSMVLVPMAVGIGLQAVGTIIVFRVASRSL